MKKKVDIILVVDCSGSLEDQRTIIQDAINEMIKSLKMSDDLFGCEVTLSLILFADKDLPGSYEFKPIGECNANISFSKFYGTTNPGPSLKKIVEKAMGRYNEWWRKKQLCCHPLIFFFTDGYPWHKDEKIKKQYQDAYKDAAEYIKEKEGARKLLLVSGAFGPNADIENLKLLTNYSDRIVKISEKNINGLVRFFSKIIPMTTVTAVTKHENELARMFKRLNDVE